MDFLMYFSHQKSNDRNKACVFPPADTYWSDTYRFIIQTAIDVFDFATGAEERLSITLSAKRVNGGCGVIENGGHHVLIGIIIAI